MSKSSNDGAGGGNPPSGNGVSGGRHQTPAFGDGYEINLTYEGRLSRHRVSQHMLVEQLITAAANEYHLNPIDLVLMLFGMNPQTLNRQNRLSDPPRVGPGATVLVFCIAGHARDMGGHLHPTPAYTRYPDGGNNENGVQASSHSYLGSKIVGNFKLPKFDGNARYWKTWDKNFIRFLSIHQLDFVIEESFLDLLPLTPRNFEANKMVYYILEDAVVTGSLAAKYLRQAAKWNGHEAYSKLHNGYVFSGPQTMSLLLAELVNIRFKADESASGFCLRLREVFEDLEMVPGPSSIIMNDTQKIGYLLSGIRQEKSLQSVYVALQDKQVRGAITFEEACDDLHHRCEAIRADELLATPIRGQQKALVSTHGKRQNKTKDKEGVEIEQAPCLESGCQETIKKFLPLCGLHYHQLVSGKTAEMTLKDNLGIAKYNVKTQRIDYPASVPKDRLPVPQTAQTRKGLVMRLPLPTQILDGRTMLVSRIEPLLQIDGTISDGGGGGEFPAGTTALCAPGSFWNYQKSLKCLASKPRPETNTFYIDSGAGQCLSSCSTAFLTLEPCHIEVIGVAGSLPIFGIGTAIFALSMQGGGEVLLRVHNCLYSFGEFNLLSVSQMQTLPKNSLELSLLSPTLRLFAGGVDGDGQILSSRKSYIDISLSLEDGLYALEMEPISPEDPRNLTTQIFDLTPPGDYVPATQKSSRLVKTGKPTRQIWTTLIVPADKPKGRIFTLAGPLDFNAELISFSDKFLAPSGLPSSRKQFDVSDVNDMSDLSVRFLGVGTDRILHTVSISNGLEKPPSKKHARVPPLNFPQGNMKEFKTPRVSKDIVGHVKTARVAECLYTDTFYTGDHKFPYAQVFVDRVSRFGDVIPLRSRTEVGSALVTFVCRHFTPLILISDNIAENHGGDLVEQCRKRDIKQLFTCPYHPQMDFAEGYIGRITTMASFAMVYSGAPLFMWIWGVKTAVFVDHIMASYYSIQKVWASPYELVHGELFPDASIIVPFGCGVLVLLPKAERAKFKSRCALMIFVHYADDHPLYTYAVYSPLTKRVLMRQDCIFLPKLFPMRIARASAGMSPDGEPLVPMRSPFGMRDGSDPELSFEGWTESDPLPEYEDHVQGLGLTRPHDRELLGSTKEPPFGEVFHRPYHPSFGDSSIVDVHAPPQMGGVCLTMGDSRLLAESDEMVDSSDLDMQHPDSHDDSTSTGATGNASIFGGGQMGSLLPDAQEDEKDPALPLDSLPLVTMGSRDSEFTIHLEFPNQDRPRLQYWVCDQMPVRLFYHYVADGILQCEDRWIRMYVNGECLMHGGTITDRHMPGHPEIPTVFLTQGCTVEVRRLPHIPLPILEDQTSFQAEHKGDVPRDHKVDDVKETTRRRASTRAPVIRPGPVGPVLRRAVKDRYFYEPVASGLPHESSDVTNESVTHPIPLFTMSRVLQDTTTFGTVMDNEADTPVIPLTSTQVRMMKQRFRAEGRRRRRLFRIKLQQEWSSQVGPSYDQENGDPQAEALMDEEIVYDGYVAEHLAQFDDDFEMQKEDFLYTLSCAGLPRVSADIVPDVLLLRRTEELWAGLHRVYFGEVEDPLVSDDSAPRSKRPRTRENVAEFKREISDTIARIRRLPPLVPDDLHAPIPVVPSRQNDPDDDMGSGMTSALPPPASSFLRDDDGEVFEFPPVGGNSNGEDDDGSDEEDVMITDLCNATDKWEAALAMQPEAAYPRPSLPPVTHFDDEDSEEEDVMITDLCNATDKWEAALATQPGAAYPRPSLPPVTRFGEVSSHRSVCGFPLVKVPFGEVSLSHRDGGGFPLAKDKLTSPALVKDKSVVFEDGNKDLDEEGIIISGFSRYHDNEAAVATQPRSSSSCEIGEDSNGENQNGPMKVGGNNHVLRNGERTETEPDSGLSRLRKVTNYLGRKILLSIKTMRRVLAFKETLHKYGVFVPKNDREADASPEATRWSSGRQLEWIRLQEQGTFERNWDWARLTKAYPQYRKQDVGHVFFVYDHKHSGEHRVRLVFDGSKQSPETYTETYAPTARGESVRLFHVFAVEEAWSISQFDVPQAFLKSQIDCDIFVYPPKNFSEFPGQLLKLRLALYGAKQSAALWNRMIDGFLVGLGFSPSPMDPCLYRRDDAIIILFCDDLRVAGLPGTVATIQAALFGEFQITTSDGTRFLGMDTVYDMEKGYLKLHMETYIIQTYERFKDFDLTRGVPFRELVGCMLWICLCVMGPELLRVKDLARRSNSYEEHDFKDAMKVLERIYEKRNQGIIFFRGGAGKEIIPSNTRNGILITAANCQTSIPDDTGGPAMGFNELREKLLYKVKEEIAAEDICPVSLPINSRYRLTIYADASFAVGELKQSVSGYLVFLNGTPLLWGSLKQTIVVDSSCSAEYVAASVACKQAIHAENLICFLGFSCSKPYTMYTDSTACLSIATNGDRLGNVRHLSIRYNLIRCYVTIGEINMVYCITEEMVADLLTKIVSGAQDTRLAVRFYNLCPPAWKYAIGNN
jgi:hypothetical protein